MSSSSTEEKHKESKERDENIPALDADVSPDDEVVDGLRAESLGEKKESRGSEGEGGQLELNVEGEGRG